MTATVETTDTDERSGLDVLNARTLVKEYPGTRALDGADFSLRRGEIHAIVGSNGAGKSTLVKIISGREVPDSGELVVGGSVVDSTAGDYLEKYSIGYVSQEGSLDPEMTVFENLFLGRELTRFGFVSYRSMRRRAEQLSEQYGFDIDVRRFVSDLSARDRKVVEILRALALNPEIVILDEPTAAIPKPDIEHLMDLMRSLKEHASIIFISHYLEEIFGVSDRITVLRDGRRVSVTDTAKSSPDRLVLDMLGEDALRAHRQGDTIRREKPTGEGPVLLAVTGLNTADGTVTQADLQVRSGEIVGIFGMVGAGKSELLEAMYGMRHSAWEDFAVDGTGGQKTWNVRLAQDAGVVLVPEDRLKNALVGSETSAWNLAGPHWRLASRWWPALARLESGLSKKAQALVTIRGDLEGQPVSTLSGGNKQKVSVCRWLVGKTPPRVLLLDEPTQGLDVIAREEIYRLIRQLADAGTGVVLASSDLEEAVTISDRVVVMRSGKTSNIASGRQTRDNVLLVATADLEEGSTS